MLESSSYLIRTARSLAINPKDPPTWSVLAGHSHTVSDSIKSLITSIRSVSHLERVPSLHLNRVGRDYAHPVMLIITVMANLDKELDTN